MFYAVSEIFQPYRKKTKCNQPWVLTIKNYSDCLFPTICSNSLLISQIHGFEFSYTVIRFYLNLNK